MIKNSVRKKANNGNGNTTHLLDSQGKYSSESPLSEASTKVFSDELLYEELEQEWARALDLDDITFEDGVGDANDEYIPSDNDNGSSDEDVDEVDGEMVDELNYELAICDVLDDYHIEKTFAGSELEELKLKERVLLERGNRGFYRNKFNHANVYAKICDDMKPYLTRKNLKMLHHGHTTQSNEALNKSVSAYTPKNKHYSTTKSLEARVGVAAAIQLDGYHQLWKQLYVKFTLTFDQSISLALATMGKHKK